MLAVLNWKLTLLALVVCLSETQCAPPGTTTRVEYELICNETIAAVSPQDCQGCPVEGCETELHRAGCWKDSDHWYKSCMGELGPCIEIRWDKNNDGSYSNSECRSRCRGLHETCSFMPVILTTTPEAPSYAPVKPAPTDTSKIDDGVIAAVVCSIAVVLIVALVRLVFKCRPDLVQKIKDLRTKPETSILDRNDMNRTNNNQPAALSENARVDELATHLSDAETRPQQNADNEGFEYDPTESTAFVTPTPSHPSSSIPVDASGAGPSTASSSSRHPTSAANASSTLESEHLILDQQDSAETPVTRLEDNNPLLVTVDSDNVDEFAAPSHEEQIASEIEQFNASRSKAPTSAVPEGATQTNKIAELDYQEQLNNGADSSMDNGRTAESRRFDEAAGGSLPVAQHATNSGGVKPSGTIEPTVRIIVPGETQKHASTKTPTLQNGLPGSPGSSVQTGTKTDNNDRTEESRRLPEAAGGSPPGAQHGAISKKVRPRGGLGMHTITLPEGLLDEAPKNAPSGNKAEKTEGPGATTPDPSQQASATTSQNGSPATSQNGSTASSPDGSPATSQNGSTETSPDGSTASSPDGSPNLSRISPVQPGTKTGGGTKVATKSRRIED